MSDYLMRMVERAAGRSAGESPRPPRRFDWGASRADGNSPGLESPVESSPELERVASRRMSQPGRTSRTGRDVDAAASVTEVFDDDAQHSVRLAPEHPARTGLLTQDFALAPSAESGVSESAPPPAAISRAGTLERNGDETSEPHGEAVNPTEGSTRPIAHSRIEPALGGEHGNFRSRENRTARKESHLLPESEEAVVEVSIGRVEVALGGPPPPTAPRAAVRPNGFAEFEALRRYAAGPWHLRRR